MPGYSSQGAFGLFAPAGTPKDIIAKIHADTAEVLAQPDVKKALEARSFVIGGAGRPNSRSSSPTKTSNGRR